MIKMIRRWIKRLLTFLDKGSRQRRRPWPVKEEIERLPPFQAIELDAIVVVSTPESARRARREILQERVVGFDTESKPTFVKGQVSTGPHVAQFSTPRRAYVMLLHDAECAKVTADLIASEALKKVGFGLSEDLRLIRKKMGIEPRNVFDVENLFGKKGYGWGVGVKVGVAIALKQRFTKSKRVSTTNWSLRRLSEKQILYAANDAFAALRVFMALAENPSK